MNKYKVRIQYIITQESEVLANNVDEAEEAALNQKDSLHCIQYNYEDYRYNTQKVEEIKE